jgi:hypothetical protein
MIAFRKNMEKQYPEGTPHLDKDAVLEYSARFYRINGELSYRRAEVLGGIINSLSDKQKARFDEICKDSTGKF